MRVLFCDRCGQEITADGWCSTVIMQTAPQAIDGTFLSGGETRWDLCGPCTLEVQKLIPVKAKTAA